MTKVSYKGCKWPISKVGHLWQGLTTRMLCHKCYAGHAFTADQWNIFLIDVLFVHHLQAIEQEIDHPDNHLDQIYRLLNGKSTNPSAEITTTEAATAHTITTPKNVTAVEMTTRSGVAHSVSSPGLVKPLPWTPMQPFILEHKLSNYPNKALVRQLIDNLQHSFAISFAGRTSVYLPC